MANLGDNYRRAGRTKDAIPLLEEALQRAQTPRQLTPSTRLDSFRSCSDLRPGGAVRQVRAALPGLSRRGPQTTRRRTSGNSHTDGPIEPQPAAAKKHADAEPVLRDCLAIRDKKQPDLWITFNTRSMLGDVLASQKKFADAEPLLLQGYEGMKQREKSIPPEGKVRSAKDWSASCICTMPGARKTRPANTARNGRRSERSRRRKRSRCGTQTEIEARFGQLERPLQYAPPAARHGGEGALIARFQRNENVCSRLQK